MTYLKMAENKNSNTSFYNNNCEEIALYNMPI